MEKNRQNPSFEEIMERLKLPEPGTDPGSAESPADAGGPAVGGISAKGGSRTEAADSAGPRIPTSDNGSLEEKLDANRRRRLFQGTACFVLLALVVGGFVLYNWLYEFQDYVISESYEVEAVSGTKYLSAGKKLYRYNSDGISCVTRKNEMEWSVTYNMQAPIADISGVTMAVAEQQGTQVYVVGEAGLVGNFETQFPILKVRVSNQGVVAVVLQDEAVTWVNLYQPDGTLVASDKTTIAEPGYPLDIDLSPDGQMLLVSYLGIREGITKSRVVFYNFGAAGQTKENNVVSQAEYTETVVPLVYFIDNATAAAVADNGFYVYEGKSAPEERAAVPFDREIVSTFHDSGRIGFLFRNEEGETDYVMELYSYGGKQKCSVELDSSYEQIKMENGQILLYSDKGLDIYTKSGRRRFSSAYEKEVAEVFYFGEFRKYLVVTRDSFDHIRVG